MRLLLTSDSQAEFSNLDLCEQSLGELSQAITKYKPDAVIHGGDLKEALNPVDIRVVKFWVRAVRRIVATGVPFFINLGNHDQIGQSMDSTHWLDVLRAAGARIATKPRRVSVADGTVCFLPYTRDKKRELKWAQVLASEVVACQTPSVLIFHTDVQGAVLTNYGTKVTVGNDVSALCFDSYTACFGGHLHQHQEVAGNGWYIGSPFCQDWGEANQRKGLLLWDSSWDEPKQFVTTIPHWYDAEYLADLPGLDGEPRQPEPGAYIRSRIEVTSKKITQQLRKEEDRLRKLYPDARLYVIPKLIQSEKLEVELTGSTDEERVSQYVAATVPEAARFDSREAVGYLASKLPTVRPGGSNAQLRIRKLEATNVLPFKEVALSYHKKGLVLLRGINRDWPKRSNGSGKTSLLSLLTVAWAGETLKGQKNDAWAREDTDEKAVVKLYLRDDRGRSIEITRQRRPHGLWLTVDGVDQSTGLSGKGKQETQGQIEELTGFDLKMLINSVYIDQTVANGFVFGTQADRMNLVNKLCDLERFDTALKSIGADIKTNGGELTDCTRQIERLEQERGSLEEDIADLERESKESMPWTIMAEKTRASLKDLKKERAALASSEGYYTELQTEMDVWTQEVIDFDNKVRAAMVSIKQLEVDAARALKLINAKKCPTCGQEALVVGKELGTFVDKKMRQEQETRRKWTEARIETQQKLEKAKASKQKYKDEVLTLDFQIEKGEDLLSQAQEGEKVESTRAAKLKGKLEAAQNKLAHNRQSEKAQRKQLKVLAVRGELLEYAQKACHRSGMPMYLAASLCPRLNQMAEEYSEIFTEGKMRVRFSVVDGEFVVDIVNPTGSESTKGQSVGESAMAGIIAAFALREMAPRTNLLVLDEPGHGLDSAGAKEFAKGLLRLRDSGRFETIIVTTHSPIIESVLEGVTVWEVRKKNGVATLSV